MDKTMFIDGVGQIHFVGGMVRLDCIEYKMQSDATGNASPKPMNTTTIVMPPQGFLAMLKSMQDLAGKLVEAGVFLDTKDQKDAALKADESK